MTHASGGALGRRHLASFRSSRISHRFTDVLVIGSGVAGLSACLEAGKDGDVEVLLVAKGPFSECSTNYAQGGVAAVLDPARHDDAVRRHVEDTLEAACELADRPTVELVAGEGVEAVERLIALGAEFDRGTAGELHFTQEGGHSRPRILHTADRTGREVFRVLLDATARLPTLTRLEETFAIDLLVGDDESCHGALVCHPGGALQAVWAKCVILATGGAGRLYRETTNPPVTTGDGVAMAFRAGAVLRDMEFVQFHPTTLYVAGADRFLITEAVRGEGGVLVDAQGRRFMHEVHPQAELAPRDVVSRGIVERMAATGENKVFLDLSAIPPARVQDRFPYILRICKSFGIDITHEPIPVRPSAHYTIGGVRVDHYGATAVPGLLAAGEVASTGLHGANRLGSNSLLEGLVFGRRAGARAAGMTRESTRGFHVPFERAATSAASANGEESAGKIDVADLQRSLQSLLWHQAGIVRTQGGLARAAQQVEEWISYALPVSFSDPEGWTLQNMLTTAYLMIRGALGREESRGVHYRADHPSPRDDWRRHQDVSRDTLSES